MKSLLFVRVFGIGNAVMSVPAIKHYRDSGEYNVTVLVGTGPDDFGAKEVLSELPGVRVVTDKEFAFMSNGWNDVVLSIPYDGRFDPRSLHAGRIHDGRPRPDPSTFGFSSWERHEAIYQLQVAESICGYPSIPITDDVGPNDFQVDSSFYRGEVTQGDYVYLGIGRKYDSAGFWEKKHWGDGNFIEFCRLVLDNHPEKRVVCTGGLKDMNGTGRALIHGLADYRERFKFTYFPHEPMQSSFRVIAGCHSYVGNDTGMMHVAASMDKPVVTVFNFEGTLRKNHPLCRRWKVLEGHSEPVTPRMVYDSWRETCLRSYSPAEPDSSGGSSSES